MSRPLVEIRGGHSNGYYNVHPPHVLCALDPGRGASRPSPLTSSSSISQQRKQDLSPRLSRPVLRTSLLPTLHSFVQHQVSHYVMKGLERFTCSLEPLSEPSSPRRQQRNLQPGSYHLEEVQIDAQKSRPFAIRRRAGPERAITNKNWKKGRALGQTAGFGFEHYGSHTPEQKNTWANIGAIHPVRSASLHT